MSSHIKKYRCIYTASRHRCKKSAWAEDGKLCYMHSPMRHTHEKKNHRNKNYRQKEILGTTETIESTETITQGRKIMYLLDMIEELSPIQQDHPEPIDYPTPIVNIRPIDDSVSHGSHGYGTCMECGNLCNISSQWCGSCARGGIVYII